MNKILITIGEEHISFGKSEEGLNDVGLTNVKNIDIKNIKFTEKYILNNLDLVSKFIEMIAERYKINKVVIKAIEIAETSLKLIKKIPTIKEVVISENREISYSVVSLLLDNHRLKKISCYNMPEVMFERFENGVVETRREYLFLSACMKDNCINTYSTLFNKDNITINSDINALEIKELNFFLSKNKNLRTIYINNYSKDKLIKTLSLLKNNNLKNINIVICEEKSTTNKMLSDIKLFDSFNKKYNVRIKIKYSKNYKSVNGIKEINIKLFRTILVLMILCLIGIVFIYVQRKVQGDNNITDNINAINAAIQEIQSNNTENNIETDMFDGTIDLNTESEHTYISSYYTNYDKVYSKLLTINDDTIGWLTVNNTKINYPVVQTMNNDYYLKHAYDKSDNQAGWVFVDYRNNMDKINQNTIVYGHSATKNDIIFGSLKYILNPKWYNNESNLQVTFNIKENLYTWRVFSIYIVDKTTDYLNTDFSTNEEFLEFINLLKLRSIHNFGVEFDGNDKILTLSTCYGNSSKRLVLHAKLIQ